MLVWINGPFGTFRPGGPLRAWLRRYATTARNIHWNWPSAG